MPPMSAITLAYKRVQQNNVLLDIYPPSSIPNELQTETPLVPAVVYFHGGGLTVGNRQSWFPTWLYKRTTSAGYAFISADYQLLPPATGHDLVRDIQDVMKFVVSREFGFAGEGNEGHVGASTFEIDPEAIAVSGSSAGGLCAYLAAIHSVSPKPKVIISMYGMGADFFSSHYLTPKTKPFFRGREILDPNDFQAFLHPNHNHTPATLATNSNLFTVLNPTSDSPLAYHPQTYHIPGYPANPRMLLSRLYLQLGVYIDYYTGEHEDGGLSVKLRRVLESKDIAGEKETGISLDENDGKLSNVVDNRLIHHVRSVIPAHHQPLFPQLNVSSSWPPTMLVHGSNDTAVLVHESRSLKRQLEAVDVHVELCEVEGREHSFDYEIGAEEVLGEQVFDRVGSFLRKYLSG